MSVALSALILFTLITPGFFLILTINSAGYSRFNFSSSLTDQIFLAIIPTLLIHTVGIYFIVPVFDTLRIDLIYYLSIGKELTSNQIDVIGSSIWKYTLYTVFVSLLAGLLGLLSKSIIVNFGLDLRYPALRLENDLYYLLKGTVLDFPDVPNNSEDIDYVKVNILCEIGNKSILYQGILDSFELDEADKIDRVVLQAAKRRYLENDADKRYYSLAESDYFVIPGHEIKNINIFYKKTENNIDWEIIDEFISSMEKGKD